MEQPQPAHKPRRPWTIGEKLVLAAVVLAVLVGGGGFAWRRMLDAPPVLPALPAPPPMPTVNGYDDFVSAAAMAQEPPYTASSATPPPGGRILTSADRAIVKFDEPAFARFRIGLMRRVVAPTPRPSGWRPDLARLRSLARSLSVQSRIQAADGQFDQAAQTTVDTIQYGEAISNGGAVLDRLLGIAVGAIARKPCWGFTQKVTPIQARRLAQRLLAVDARAPTMAQAVAVERPLFVERLAEVLASPSWRSDLCKIVNDFGDQTDRDKATAARLPLTFTSKQKIIELASLEASRYTTVLSSPYSPVPPAESPDSVAKLIDEVFAGSLQSLRHKQAYNAAENRLLAVTLALRAYQVDNGSYPPTLATLVPAYLPAVPQDPYLPGRTVAYRRAGSSYMLYSVGPDGTDDGGKAIIGKSGRRWVEKDSTGDIVAGVNP